MKAPCKKCGKMFERHARYCMLCDDCWKNSRKGPNKPFSALKTCPICSELILKDDVTINIVKTTPVKTNKKDRKSIGRYHFSCWEKNMPTKIKKTINKNRLSSWVNHLNQGENI